MTANLLAHWINSAHAANQSGDYAAAITWCKQVLKLAPDMPEAWYNLAVAQNRLGNRVEALEALNAASRRTLKAPDAQNSIGHEFMEMQAFAEAKKCFERAVATAPNHAFARTNLGIVLARLGRIQEAESSLNKAIQICPDLPQAHVNLAGILNSQKRFEAAERHCNIAIALELHLFQAWVNLGNALFGLTEYEKAEAAFRRATEINQKSYEAWSNLGLTLQAMKRYQAAEKVCEKAIAVSPNEPDAYKVLGLSLRKQKRYLESIEAFRRLVEVAPDHPFAKGGLMHAKMICCDWDGLPGLYEEINAEVRKGRRSAEPFGYQAIAESESDLHACARIYAAEYFPNRAAHGPAVHGGEKIRIGYVSGEFRTQATSILMAQLFELHDKSRFEIYAFDNGFGDGGELRARMESAFKEFVDISRLGDREAAAEVTRRNIDILVNLNGYFGDARTGLFSLKPAPIQVNYLGFPGTIGADYIDYLIADKVVIPEDSRQHYSEKIVYLPNCYQSNDGKRKISDRVFSRPELGLPDSDFVFCCFNNNYKLTPKTFDCWMRILKRVDGAVLWLLEDNSVAAANLRKEAAARGVDPQRLVFAQRMKPDEHLARHRLADLFLDSLPYNAHTTASDALWAGLPVLTQKGTTFPGRVAASLLTAIGLTELIVSNETDYEALAVELATNRDRLAQLKSVLESNRQTTPLFDAPLFAGHIEAAYSAMYERSLSGLAPACIEIK